jgi:hypothetical protein
VIYAPWFGWTSLEIMEGKDSLCFAVEG